MLRGDRRGCVKLKNAQVGIDDEDDSTFTITVDHRTFHFQARDSNERQKWLDALQEARDLHTQNYALLHHTSRLLDQSASLPEFDRRIVEADAYLQILIDQQQDLSVQNAETEEFPPEVMDAVNARMQKLIELVKKTIVCLQFARESMPSKYTAMLTVDRLGSSTSFPDVSTPNHQSTNQNLATVQTGNSPQQATPSISINSPQSSLPKSASTLCEQTAGEGDGVNCQSPQICPHVPSSASLRLPSNRTGRRTARATAELRRPASSAEVSDANAVDVADSVPPPDEEDDLSLRTTTNFVSVTSKAARDRLPLVSYASSDEGSQPPSGDEDEEFFDTHEDPSAFHSPSHNHEALRFSAQMSANNQQSFVSTEDDLFDELYDDCVEEDLGSVQSQGSIITHLLSQLRIGMDLTRITLPTFILERRSTLEMYADFLAHADLWAMIPDGRTPRDRMIACLRWYLSAFHAGRRSSLAKKPYNPILGEIFRCYWSLPSALDSHNAEGSDARLRQSGPVSWASKDSVVFLAEQVSHHPPISAFYAEHVGRRISLDGHLWTKSKFLGLSIAVEMVGSAVITLLNFDEEYLVTFPCGYGRNILSVPWIELGGKTSITCAKTGYTANIEFKTKPFYNGKKDFIRADVFEPNEKKPILSVEGEWNDKMIVKWCDGSSEIFVDTRSMPVLRKKVLPRAKQAENESRRLWEHVTRNLKNGDIDAATDAKCRLEQKQRELARYRQENKLSWIPKYFRGEGGAWVYRSPLVSRLAELSSMSSFTAAPLSTSTQQSPSTDVLHSDLSD